MIKKITLLISFHIFLSAVSLFSQIDPYMVSEEIEEKIDLALDAFSSGDYEEALRILNLVLEIDSTNQRAKDLIESINELYNIETDRTDDNDEEPYITERPDFNIKEPPSENPDEELNKPDFSVRNDDSDLLQPEDTRSFFEFSFSPNLVLPWNIGEDSVVFPLESGYSTSFNGDINYYFKMWNRIFGFNGSYTLFLLNVIDEGFAADKLHVVDVMFSFRTFFLETLDSRIIFKFSVGYRGYFSNGYDFFVVEKRSLNGFNMGVNLEAPLLYLFWDREILKRIIFDVDMNLLFFPEQNTLNLFDFRFSGEFRFNHFSAGLHFGAYSIITSDAAEYL